MRNFKKQVVCTVKVPVLFKKKRGYYLAYCPPFDLMTQGGNFRKADSNIRDAVELFLEDLFVHGTLEKALQELGWTKTAKAPERPRSLPFRDATQRSINVNLPLLDLVNRERGRAATA